MTVLADVINNVVEDTGRYELLDNAILKSNIVRKAQNFLESYMTHDLLITRSKQVLLTTGVYGGDLGRIQSLNTAWVSESGVSRAQLTLVPLEHLFTYADAALSEANRGLPEYIAFGNADMTTFTDGFLASPSDNAFVVWPVPDRTVTVRLLGNFLPDLLTDSTPSTSIYFNNYQDLFELAMKAQLEFNIRNVEGYNQFKAEMLEGINRLLTAKVVTEWNTTNKMED